MIERTTLKRVMVYEALVFGELEYKFEKVSHKHAGGVNVYLDGKEVDFFTNYSIEDNVDRFEDACNEYLMNLYAEEE